MEKPINGFFVYVYQYDDDKSGWKTLTKQDLIASLTDVFKTCGWEGDGTLQWMSVPPFFGDGTTGRWFTIYHVKQSHRGMSWIASKYRLTVEELNADLPRSLFEDAVREAGR
jgi:hypothetical protein